MCACVCVCVCAHAHVLVAQPCPTLCNPTDCSPQAPLSMGFPKQDHSSGLPFPSLGDLPHPGTEPSLPVSQADSLASGPPE